MLSKLDILLDKLSDGQKWDRNDLVKYAGYKNRTSLRMAVHRLRQKGHAIKTKETDEVKPRGRGNRGNYCYQMEVRDLSDYHPCMILKRDWPSCFGQGCRHKENCEAVPGKRMLIVDGDIY